MHPVISQAVGAERTRDRHADAESRRRVAEIRRTRQGGRRLSFIRVPGAGSGPQALRALRTLRVA